MKRTAAACQFMTADSWVILSPIEQSIKRKIEAIGTPLKDWDINIYRGVLTGCNEAFIISSEKRDEILADCKTDDERKRTAELIRPILRGRDIKRYGYEWANLWLIATFPSRQYDIDQVPAIKKYLLSFGKERLEQTGATHIVNGTAIKARKKTSNKWFETQDSISYWDDFSKPKIVWGEMSDRAKFALDATGEYCMEATTFLLTGNCLEYLTCYLNSTLAEYLFSKIGTTTGVGTVRWKKFKIEELYVPSVSETVEKRFAEFLCQTERNITSNEIDNSIFELCGLTAEEVDFVRRHASNGN